MKKVVFLLFIMGFILSCSSDDDEIETREFIHGHVHVGIKTGTQIDELFDLINSYDLQVDNINSITFTSDMPADSLQFVINKLNEKLYTNDGVDWFVTGYLQTNQIHIFPRLFGMENLTFQSDWLETMDTYQLNEKHNAELNSGIIYFIVPDGEEIEWRNRFRAQEIVDWANLNYIIDIEPWP